MAPPRNDLNDLTGTEWIKFTRTWFVCDSPRYHRNKDTELHPARFPEEMVADFLRFFTKERQFVLDPFLGSGATLVACLEQGRQGVGIELSPRYARVARRRHGRGGAPSPPAGRSGDRPLPRRAGLRPRPLDRPYERVIEGDAMHVADPQFWAPARAELESAGLRFQRGLPQFDFVITSPPYWNMLRTSRGGVESKHKLRAKQDLDTHYSDSAADLGNITDYDDFIEAVGKVFDRVHRCLAAGKYLVVVAQNLRAPEGEVKPLAWDLARRIGCRARVPSRAELVGHDGRGRRFLFQGEKVWCQNTKPLGIWGYPKIFVPNYHHHYCLIFRKAP